MSLTLLILLFAAALLCGPVLCWEVGAVRGGGCPSRPSARSRATWDTQTQRDRIQYLKETRPHTRISILEENDRKHVWIHPQPAVYGAKWDTQTQSDGSLYTTSIPLSLYLYRYDVPVRR